MLNLKSIFARHGILQAVVSDNGHHNLSKMFSNFASEYSFTHVTCSPKYSQSNGEAERVYSRTIKSLLNKVGDQKDPSLALMI